MDHIIIVDDHPLFLDALTLVIHELYPASCINSCTNLEQTYTLLSSEHDVDLVLLDIHIPNISGLEGLVQLRQLYPLLPVAMVSAEQDPKIINESMALGAIGFIPKSLTSKQLRQALRHIAAGHTYLPPHMHSATCNNWPPIGSETLTRKQIQVWQLMSQGASNKAIGEKLFIAESTVKAHVTEILRKLGVTSRVEAIMLAQKTRLNARMP